MNSFSYKTIRTEGQSIFKDKGSKFLGFSFRVQSEEDVKVKMDELKKQFHDARHHCYAYRLFASPVLERANDDGEPSNSAGAPILNQIYSYELYNVLVVVVRYFGGTKLGVAGLISAYKQAAKDALEDSRILKVDLIQKVSIECGYDHLHDVMRIVKQHNLKILEQQSTNKVRLIISIKLSKFETIMDQLRNNIHLSLQLLDQ